MLTHTKSVTRLSVPAVAVVTLALASLAAGVPATAQGANSALIKLTYRCGNYFRARNANNTDVLVQYSVYRTSETGTLTLPAAVAGVGYSDTYFATNARGAVLLTYNGNRVAQKPNGGAACSPLATMGQWTDTASWPLMAVHSSLLPNGKVLSWGREYASTHGFTIPPGRTNGIPTVWDPVTNAFQQVDAAGADLFCSGQTFMADGRLVQMGGHSEVDGEGTRTSYIYNYSSNSWAKNATNMKAGRWYPTVTPLGTGEQLVIGGTDTTGAADTIPEILQANGTFRELTGAKQNLPYFPFTFLAPDGRVFYAGDSPNTFWLTTSGTGSVSASISTGETQFREYGSAVMYDIGKIIIMGGGHTLATAEVIDLTQASPSWRHVQSMAFPRRQMNALILANGKVLASGGSAGPDFNPATNIVLIPEIWDPVTELWTQMPAMKMPRLYHSETVLLRDGRVLSVGGGQPAAAGLSDNFNAEIYSPPYLFNPDGSPVTASRPVISSAPATVTYGAAFGVQVLNAPVITKALFIRLTAVTHAINMSQRLVPLTFTQSGHTVTLTAPATANIAPPGDYLLFLLNGNGVPSVAVDIRIG